MNNLNVRPENSSLEALSAQIKTLFDAQLETTVIPELDIALHLLEGAIEEKQFSPEQVEDIWGNMPYWAFAWSSGRALARFILDNPHLVADKRICDFGAGSAIVAIAALKAGAACAWACDIDPMAHLASAQNALLNGFTLNCCETIEQAGEIDLLVVGDVLYDTRNHGLAKTLFSQDCEVLWGESQAQTKLSEYAAVAKYQAHTQPNIGGFDEHQFIHIYHHLK